MPPPAKRAFSFDAEDTNDQIHGNTLPTGPPSYEVSSRERRGDNPPTPPAHHFHAPTANPLPPLDTQQPRAQDLSHSMSNRTTSTITPGADNMGDEAAGGGIAGVALGVAYSHQRGSGLDAMSYDKTMQSSRQMPLVARDSAMIGSDTPYIPAPPSHGAFRAEDPFASPTPSRRSNPFDDESRRSPPSSPGHSTPLAHKSTTSIPMDLYPPQHTDRNSQNYFSDNPYKRFSTAWDPRVARGDIDPDEIDDDGEDDFAPPQNRASQYGTNGRYKTASSPSTPGATAIPKASRLSALGGFFGSKTASVRGSRDTSGQYGPVHESIVNTDGTEKSEWLHRQNSGRRKLRWLVGILVFFILVGAIVGGILGGLHSRSSSDSDSSETGAGASAAEDDARGDLDKDSAEIKKLMNDPALHKVFPGMDYTPFNAQYPACLTNPPSQNNVTRDVAVLSQLTDTIRLYGTDCNQTDMVLHAIDKLALPAIKVWLGVWLDSNTTTNERGLNTMYDILARNGADPFAGVIVGNEVLYRKDLTESQLGDILLGVKQNFTTLKYSLPVAVSDLGDDWTADLAGNVDVVMSNVHPFFAGVSVETAASWTWDFWQQHDVILTEGKSQQNIIAEVGWPSSGGTDCGAATTCTNGSVAGIDEMNTFMGDFICQSLANKTNFFWFEAFDEPWKISLNTPGKEWENRWGLLDSGRKLKAGVKIPDCGNLAIA